MDATTVATECPYCGNSAVVPERVANMLRPDLIIPFRMDKSIAKDALRKFYKGKVLLPKFFKDDNRIDNINGMYVPFWLYDCDTSSTAVYDATRKRTWRSGDTEYTQTDHYLVTRAGNMNFEKIPAGGSSKMDEASMEAVEPFEYKDIAQLSMAYLSGYKADKYNIDAETNKPRVNQRIRHTVDGALRGTVRGYATVSTRSLNVNAYNAQVRYALMPIWMLNTRWNRDLYTFAINGQTGKLVGELPIDWKKAWKLGGIISAGAAAVLIPLGILAELSSDALSTLIGISLLGILGAGLSYLPFLPYFKNKKKKKEEERKAKGEAPTDLMSQINAKSIAGNAAGSLASKVGGNFLGDVVRNQVEKERKQ
jgi:hypothetical protein